MMISNTLHGTYAVRQTTMQRTLSEDNREPQDRYEARRARHQMTVDRRIM